jgi:hypothetical protein
LKHPKEVELLRAVYGQSFVFGGRSRAGGRSN